MESIKHVPATLSVSLISESKSLASYYGISCTSLSLQIATMLTKMGHILLCHAQCCFSKNTCSSIDIVCISTSPLSFWCCQPLLFPLPQIWVDIIFHSNLSIYIYFFFFTAFSFFILNLWSAETVRKDESWNQTSASPALIFYSSALPPGTTAFLVPRYAQILSSPYLLLSSLWSSPHLSFYRAIPLSSRLLPSPASAEFHSPLVTANAIPTLLFSLPCLTSHPH